jgi:hypothetical protein
MLSIKLLRLKSPCVAATLEDTVEATVVMVAIAVVHLQEEVEGVLAAAMVDVVNKGRP